MANPNKLPDPLGYITNIKRKLNPKSSVAKSRFVDVIISMRLQGVNYQAIEKWLTDQGQEHRIPSSTIFRNMKNVDISLPYAEELAERYGGRLDLDIAREMAGQAIAQRNRVDRLQREEEKELKNNPRYNDKRIRPERELLMLMLKELHLMQKDPLQAAAEALQADAQVEVTATPQVMDALKEALISGNLKVGTELPESISGLIPIPRA